MARPTKQGVDYFPLDVYLDDKFKYIEIKFGVEGFGIVIKLLQKIYGCGYWYCWSEDEQLLFSDEIRTDLDKVLGVVGECIKRGIFDPGLYEKYHVLTSKGIQKRYFEIVKRRRDTEISTEYLLIDINACNNAVNVDNNPSTSEVIASKSTQSKVKESKEEEITTTTAVARASAADSRAVITYIECFGEPGKQQEQELLELEQVHGVLATWNAIRIAARMRPPPHSPVAYVRKVVEENGEPTTVRFGSAAAETIEQEDDYERTGIGKTASGNGSG